MSRASTPTLLSLDRYSQIINWSPAAWNQGVSNFVFPGNTACRTIFQYAWQDHDAISREEVATEIAQAEQDIAEYLGWWPAPRWIAQDVKMYPRFYRPEYYGVGGSNLRLQLKSIKTSYGKVIEPGQRGLTPIDLTVTPDFDSFDGNADFDETVTVEAATTLTDECEIKVYFEGHNGDPEWEIRPARTKVIDSGMFTATFYAWQFIDPDLWEAFPTHANDGTPAADLDDPASYVTNVEIYREYNDPTAISAAFYWEGQPTNISGNLCSYCYGTGCEHCTLTVQYGCIHIRDAEMGFVVGGPGTYDEDDGAWDAEPWTICRDPDQMKVYYYCGNLSELNLAGRRCDGLSDQWARIIAHLATARLHRPLCDCGGVSSLVDYLQTDLALGTREATYTVLWDDLSNPFGTRVGEMEAYRHCRNLVPGRQRGAGAV